MSYDDVEIEDMEWNEEIQAYTYPCPCGDLFQITKEDLHLGEEIANCPSCSLYITVIYNMEDFQNDTKNNNEPKSRQAVALFLIKYFHVTKTKCTGCSFSDYSHENMFASKKSTSLVMPLISLLKKIAMNHFLCDDWCTEYSPCSDTQISKRDGFIVGVAISSREAFFLDQVQLYPCDSRLGLAAKMAQLVLFRPKIKEVKRLFRILLPCEKSEAGGYMVGFAGSKYAIRSFFYFFLSNTQ
ncbi:unnamed protein product [Brassica rapa subsp. trilocularis]